MKMRSGTLVWNVGSSSVKGALMVEQKVLWRWQSDSVLKQLRWSHQRTAIAATSAKQIVAAVVAQLPHSIRIERHIHRIVYGGSSLWRPTKASTAVTHTLQRYRSRDPLHLPAALNMFHLVKQQWPTATGWFVFDSGIYEHLPPMVREYALPRWVVDRYHLRRFGFHGVSHWWSAQAAAQRQHQNLSRWSGITVHLGSGSSITAWRQGRPIDTSMGFSPLGGPIMATRSGDLDPLVPIFLVRQAGMTPQRVEAMLNKQSGILALTGSADIRDALSALGHHHHEWPPAKKVRPAAATLAIDMFTYEVARYIGSYTAVVGGVPQIVFTGAIGQNTLIQKKILRWLHQPQPWKVVTVPADEERAMAALVDSMV